MRWPFIRRSHHEAVVRLLDANLDARMVVIKALREELKLRIAEVKALSLTLEAKKCNDYTPEATEKKKLAEPVLPSRSGWRNRARIMADATIPIKDSAAALQERVKREGGV